MQRGRGGSAVKRSNSLGVIRAPSRSGSQTESIPYGDTEHWITNALMLIQAATDERLIEEQSVEVAIWRHKSFLYQLAKHFGPLQTDQNWFLMYFSETLWDKVNQGPKNCPSEAGLCKVLSRYLTETINVNPTIWENFRASHGVNLDKFLDALEAVQEQWMANGKV
eukprot:1902473-Amphidinium_carterae.2